VSSGPGSVKPRPHWRLGGFRPIRPCIKVWQLQLAIATTLKMIKTPVLLTQADVGVIERRGGVAEEALSALFTLVTGRVVLTNVTDGMVKYRVECTAVSVVVTFTLCMAMTITRNDTTRSRPKSHNQ